MSKTTSQVSGATLNVTLNGESRELSEGVTVLGLLEELGIARGKVAVERNRSIVPRSQYGETDIENGDRIEIVRFVGGG